MIETLYNQFSKLKQCTKKKEKEEVLNKHKDDKSFCYILDFLIDKQKITGISTSKINKEYELVENPYKDNLIDLLDYLLIHNTGRKIDVQIVQAFIKQIDNESIKQMVKEIVTKKYKCGVTDKTVYDIIPTITRNWEMRKGHSLKDIDKQLKDKDIIVTIKLDGFRYPVIKRSNNDIDIRTSAGYREDGLVDIIEQFKNPNIPIGVYDCECVAIGNFSTSLERYNATSRILSKKGEKKGIKMMCFDYIADIEKFDNYEVYKTPCFERKIAVQSILSDLYGGNKYTLINCVKPIFISKNENVKDLLNKLFENAMQRNEEGLIIDIADAPYERKKGNTMFKMKPVLTGDFKVIDLEEGTNKNKNKLGAFIIEYKGNKVNIGSGISDKLREEVWSNKNFYINKLIEVSYMEESKDENNNLSLRLPRFKRLRHDKNPNDVSYD